ALVMALGLWPVGLIVYEKLVYGAVIHEPSTVLAAFLLIFGFQIIVLGLLADMSLRNNMRLEKLLRKQKREN
ncbi:MAG: hypothetical protein V1817_04495, partial [Candidatus Micrarchaeota archaeon]